MDNVSMTIPDREKISVGNIKIDLEHQQIFATLERIENACLSKQDMILVCERLVHYISDHVLEEELLMIRNKYPNLQEHQSSHTELQKIFLNVLDEFAKTGNKSDHVIDAFTEHIITHDIPMIEYINNKDKLT